MLLYLFVTAIGWQYSTHLHTNSTQNTAVQYTFTHKQYTQYREWNIQNTYITIKKSTNLGSAGCALCLQVIPWHLPYNWGKSTETPSVRVVEKCPDIPVAAVQYTFTHKQYTEYRDRNIHNNKKKVKKIWLSAVHAPSLRVTPWYLPYNWGKSTEKPQLG
jgi:hypothetical protein